MTTATRKRKPLASYRYATHVPKLIRDTIAVIANDPDAKGGKIPRDLTGSAYLWIPRRDTRHGEHFGPYNVTIRPGAPANGAKSSSHRVYLECDCGKQIPAGRFHQHKTACPAGSARRDGYSIEWSVDGAALRVASLYLDDRYLRKVGQIWGVRPDDSQAARDGKQWNGQYQLPNGNLTISLPDSYVTETEARAAVEKRIREVYPELTAE